MAESEQERSKRRSQRMLFDRVAELYDACRLGYPSEIVEWLAATAALGAGSAVLEVGCGTGQLTADLAHFGYDLTAIDIGPSMIAAARRRTAGSAVAFQVTAFEDLAVPAASYDLIVSGTAFHWLDPEVKFAKSARLLRPGGWLALLATGERYDEPFGSALREMWTTRASNRRQILQDNLANTEIIQAGGLFGQPVRTTHARRLAQPVDTVIAVENTRATSLSWPDDVRCEFTEELRYQLCSQSVVELTQETSLTMAQVLCQS